jgi:hypothetical protein
MVVRKDSLMTMHLDNLSIARARLSRVLHAAFHTEMKRRATLSSAKVNQTTGAQEKMTMKLMREEVEASDATWG